MKVSRVQTTRLAKEQSIYSRPLMGIMNSFPTQDGNHISSDEEEEEQQEDSDPYIGVAYGSTYWNKGGIRFISLYTHLE